MSTLALPDASPSELHHTHVTPLQVDHTAGCCLQICKVVLLDVLHGVLHHTCITHLQVSHAAKSGVG